MSKLVEAVLRSDLEAMKVAISSGHDLNSLEEDMTPLRWAVMRGDLEAVGLLLQSGADPNVQSYISALHFGAPKTISG